MISCQTFRATVRAGSDDADVLEHLRTCDACLDHALSIDPDFFFRAIGGAEMVPPGGVDTFVSDVMAQVRSRQTETVASMRMPVNRYLRAAAAVLLVITAATGVMRYGHVGAPAPTAVAMTAEGGGPTRTLTTKALVETYQSKNATIVEMPVAANETKVVMIYDESLPADL